MFKQEILLIIIIFIIGLAYSIKESNIFNPVTGFYFSHSIPVLIFYAFNSSYLEIDEFLSYKEYDLKGVVYVYFLACMAFLVPWLINLRFVKFNYKKICMPHNELVINSLALLLFLDLIICITYLGNIPLLEMVSGHLNIEEHLDRLNLLPMGLMALQTGISIVLVIILIISIIFGKGFVFKIHFFPAFIILASASWQGSRQLALFLVFTLVVIYSFRYNIYTIKRMFLTFLIFNIFIAFFILIQDYRLNGINSSPFEFLAYLTMPDLNFNSILNSYPEFSEASVMYLYRELIPHRFILDDYESTVMPILFEPTSPSGYLAYWYLDLGLPGVLLGALIMGIFSKYSYDYRFSSIKYFIFYILILWVVFTSGVYSHFISLNNFIIPLLIVILLPIGIKKNNTNNICPQ